MILEIKNRKIKEIKIVMYYIIKFIYTCDKFS